MKNNKTVYWIGGIILFIVIIIGGIAENSASNSSLANNAQNQVAIPAAQTAPVDEQPHQMQVQGGTVTTGGYSYKLLPINELNASGSFATEGTIAQVIPNNVTTAHVPYDFVIESDGSFAVIEVVVPAGQEQDFDVNIFPIGTDIQVAGDIFPYDSPPGVMDYSVLMQGTDNPPALRQLNLPPDTPVMLANFQDIKVLR